MKKIHILIIIILATLTTQAQKSTGKLTGKLKTQRDSSYFIGEWNMYSYSISKPGDTTFHHYTSESNGYYDKKGFIPNADPVSISSTYERDSTLGLFWLYEKGIIELKFAAPDTLFFDARVYVDAPHEWKAYKVYYISANEFIIKNWRWENCVNRFVKRPKQK